MLGGNLQFLVSIALATIPVLASPLVAQEVKELVARQGFGSCRDQSCEIAAVAGSTGATVYPYAELPQNGTQSGDCCIIRYFPAIKDVLYGHNEGLQEYCAANGGDAPLDTNPPGVSSVSAPYLENADNEKRGSFFSIPSLSLSTCKPKILIFAKGSLEPGDLGIVVGPYLAASLNPLEWQIVGVPYDNSLDNNNCLGLPGGINVRQALHTWAAKCPNSLIAMSGYSQGCLTVRNALARAPAKDVARVKNVVTFGDPFSGAQIGQYSGPINVFCMTDDGVCNGELDIGLAHVSYYLNVAQAAYILETTPA